MAFQIHHKTVHLIYMRLTVAGIQEGIKNARCTDRPPPRQSGLWSPHLVSWPASTVKARVVTGGDGALVN